MEEDEQHSINFVPCLKWVKRGVAKANPDKVELNETELAEIIKKAKKQLRDHGEEVESDEEKEPMPSTSSTKPGKISEDDEFNFADYDNEEAEPDALMGIGNLAMYGNDNEQGSMESARVQESGLLDHDDSDSEKEDDEIKPEDNLILVGHVEGDCSILEVFLYNEDEGSLYVHHDFLLPSFPLCIEWLNFDPSDPNPGNLCAIGTMDPIIEVWDLDIIDCLESAYFLGEKKKKKKKIKNKPKEKLRRGHTDAVLSLAWNHEYNHVLASGSVDSSVLLWDLNVGKPSEDFRVFDDKVQALQWHPFEAHTLLSGSCDKTTRVFDCRDTSSGRFLKWDHEGEVETVAWNSHEPFCFLTGTSNGYLTYIDCRNESILWSFKAHEKEITGLHISDKCPGLLTTASNDGKISTWDLYNDPLPSEGLRSVDKPTQIAQKDSFLGALHCLGACPENPFTLAVGGDKRSKNFRVIDLKCNSAIISRFEKRKLIQLKVQDTEEMADTVDEMNSLTLKS